jgi:hypothetical protein
MGPITFIVGAGASCDFKSFPIGSALARSIDTQLSIELANRDGPIISTISANGGFGDAHRIAMARITNGIHSRDSIDQFVDDCRNEPLVAQIAKLAISHAMLSAESTCELRVDNGRQPEVILRTMRDTWPGYICRYANSDFSRQDFLESLRGISFVTFNYDRSIERFLLIWVQATLRINYESAAELVARIPIMHVFGQIGHLPGLPVPGMAPIVFGETTDWNVWRGAQGIKTFTEEVDSAHGQAIRALVGAASTVVFLGFHFHSQNLKILFEEGWPRGVNVFATTFNMSPRRQNRITAALGSYGCRETTASMECWPFMQQFGEEIFED